MVAFVGLAEWLTGWKRTNITFWSTHLITLVLLSLIVSLIEHQLRSIGLKADRLARDVGSSAGYFVCLGIVISRMKHSWNLVIETILFSIFVIALFTPVGIDESSKLKFSADLAHMLAFPLGCLSAGVCFTQIIRRPIGTEKVLSDK